MNRAELFSGTAEYYAKFRVGYPEKLIKLIADKFELTGEGSLLDLGCGTGQLIIALHQYFLESVALDINPEMLAETERICKAKKITNISFLELPAEEVGAELGEFDLIVCGNAFHWMDRKLVLDKCYELIKPNGGIAIFASGSLWREQELWQREVKKVVKDWLGEKRRAGSGYYQVTEKKHQDYLRGSQFQRFHFGDFCFEYEWNVDSIIGYLYSTSFCNKTILGDRAKLFERDLKKSLLNLNPEGVFTETIEVSYFFAWKR